MQRSEFRSMFCILCQTVLNPSLFEMGSHLNAEMVSEKGWKWSYRLDEERLLAVDCGALAVTMKGR